MHRRNFIGLATAGTAAVLAGQDSVPRIVTLHQELNAKPSWDSIRDEFLMTERPIYFNTGGLGPTPRVVLDVVSKTLFQLQTETSHGHHLITEARKTVADYAGCHSHELAFTRNATEGNSTIASGIELGRGDEVIMESHAHKGGSLSWMARQKRNGVVIRIFDPDPESVEGNLARIEQLITPRTRAIQISHVTAPTGIRMPVKEIGELARRRRIWFHIDGAQSLGMFPFRIHDLNCDSFATCCHKWMCGPCGTGFLFVRGDRLDEITPTDTGTYADQDWDLPATLTWEAKRLRYECGTRDATGIAGVVRAIEFLNALDQDTIMQHGLTLARHLRERLWAIENITVISPTSPALQTAMVSFQVHGHLCDDVFQNLSDRKFVCRRVRERGLNAIRISTHLFNTIQDCDSLADEIRELYG